MRFMTCHNPLEGLLFPNSPGPLMMIASGDLLERVSALSEHKPETFEIVTTVVADSAMLARANSENPI